MKCLKCIIYIWLKIYGYLTIERHRFRQFHLQSAQTRSVCIYSMYALGERGSKISSKQTTIVYLERISNSSVDPQNVRSLHKQ